MSEENIEVDFEMWIKEKEKHPHFLYWSTVLELELLVLDLVRSIREGKFLLYVQLLSKLVPWMFALDLTNYSRWLPVHIKDLVQIQEMHPSVYSKFEEGFFVVQKTQHHFSKIALDQNHEQMNEVIKGDGGAVGLTENEAALKRWMVSGPEIARIVNEFEDCCSRDTTTSHVHHDQKPSVQKLFVQDVKSLISVIDDLGNPFCEKSSDLLVLDTKEMMSEVVIKSVTRAKEIGQSKYETYVKERLENRTIPISDTIERTNLSLFGSQEKRSSKGKSQIIADLKSDNKLFAGLYIACQSRQGNLQDFFKHENSSSPPSLAVHGKLRHGQKADLLDCIEAESQELQRPSVVDAKVLDAAAVVNMLNAGRCKTFHEYKTNVFLPYVATQAHNGLGPLLGQQSKKR